MNIVVFWDVTSRSSICRYHVLKEPAASVFKVEGFFTLKLEQAGSFQMLYLATRLHGIASQEATVLVITVM